MEEGSTLAYKRGASEPFLQRANKRTVPWTQRTSRSSTLTTKPLIEAMAASNVPTDILPCVIIAKLETGETVEMASAAKCSLSQGPTIMRPVIMLKLLNPRIVHRYPPETTFDDMEPLEDREGEPLAVEEKDALREEWMRDDEPGPSNRKRGREPDYEADDEESDARSHPHVKKSKRYVIVSESEEETEEPEDDKKKDPDYIPRKKDDEDEDYDDLFKDEGYPFKKLQRAYDEQLRRERENLSRQLTEDKEESIGSNLKKEEEPQEDEGRPFKKINEDWSEIPGMVEEGWYEPRGEDSLRYHYNEEQVEYILRRRGEKPKLKKEVIDLTGDSD